MSRYTAHFLPVSKNNGSHYNLFLDVFSVETTGKQNPSSPQDE
jgi:hypothetical protein